MKNASILDQRVRQFKCMRAHQRMDSLALAKLFCSAPLILKFPGCGQLSSHQQNLVLHRLLVVSGATNLQKSPFLLAV